MGCRPHPFGCNFIIVVIIFINIIVQITLFSQRVGFHLPPFGQLLSGVVIVIIVYIIIVIITSFNHDIHCDHPNRHTDHRLVRREYWVALQLPENHLFCFHQKSFDRNICTRFIFWLKIHQILQYRVEQATCTVDRAK